MKNRSTGRLGRLFNVIIPGVAACNARGSQPLKNTTRFPITTFGNDVARGYLRGFTLIELLVVVLIIGILSAIALPQYNKAVLRSRAATGFALLSALDQAQTAYHLANGTYTTDLEALGMGTKNGLVCTATRDDSLVYCQGFNAKRGQGLFFEWQGTHSTAQKYWICAALTGNEAAQSVCRSYYQEWRGTSTPSANSENGYTYYFGAPR